MIPSSEDHDKPGSRRRLSGKGPLMSEDGSAAVTVPPLFCRRQTIERSRNVKCAGACPLPHNGMEFSGERSESAATTG